MVIYKIICHLVSYCFVQDDCNRRVTEEGRSSHRVTCTYHLAPMRVSVKKHLVEAMYSFIIFNIKVRN